MRISDLLRFTPDTIETLEWILRPSHEAMHHMLGEEMVIDLGDHLASLRFRITDRDDVQALEDSSLDCLSNGSAQLVLKETLRHFLPEPYLQTVLHGSSRDNESITTIEDADEEPVSPVHEAPQDLHEKVVDHVPWVVATMPDSAPGSYVPITALLVQQSSKLAFMLCDTSIASLELKGAAIFQEIRTSFSDSCAPSALPTLGLSAAKQLLQTLRIQITSAEAMEKIA
jgi:hypothetical protein